MTFDEQQVLLEFIQIGNSVKVSAIDPKTGTEVSITGPASASEQTLSRNAVKKLKYVLARGEQ